MSPPEVCARRERKAPPALRPCGARKRRPAARFGDWKRGRVSTQACSFRPLDWAPRMAKEEEGNPPRATRGSLPYELLSVKRRLAVESDMARPSSNRRARQATRPLKSASRVALTA